MLKATVGLILLCGAVALAQTTDTSQSSATSKPPKNSKDEITVKGCLGKLSTDYILTLADEGNSYELQGSRKMRLGPYLGQEVEVTGVEQPSMSTSSDYLTRTGAASSVTIVVLSIKMA